MSSRLDFYAPVTRTSQLTLSQNTQGNSRTYTLRLELSSAHPFDVSHLSPIVSNRHHSGRWLIIWWEQIQTGEQVGQYALVIKTWHDLAGFWRLPHEIKQIILRYVMTNASPVHIRGRGYRIYSPRAQMRYPETTNPYGAAKFKALKLNETLTPGLLTAGKQLSSEAVEALYGGNVFSTTSSNLPIFLSTIGDMACESLHRLQIEVEIAKDWKLSGLSCLSKLPHLRELQLSFARVGGKYVQLFAAKLIFEQTRKWITKLGEARHDKFAAANIIKATSGRMIDLTSQGCMPPYDRPSREMAIRDAGCSNFQGDLRKFIEEPGLAESDELSVCFVTRRLPQQYSGPEWSRWRIIEDVKAKGVCLDDLGGDTVYIGPMIGLKSRYG